jgi:hypothetical protein
MPNPKTGKQLNSKSEEMAGIYSGYFLFLRFPSIILLIQKSNYQTKKPPKGDSMAKIP